MNQIYQPRRLKVAKTFHIIRNVCKHEIITANFRNSHAGNFESLLKADVFIAICAYTSLTSSTLNVVIHLNFENTILHVTKKALERRSYLGPILKPFFLPYPPILLSLLFSILPSSPLLPWKWGPKV
jgi:hypothetical protein